MIEYTNLDDNSLVHLLKANDNEAFAEIYRRFWKKLFTVAAHKLQHLAEAEEVVQDIFLDLWNRRDALHISHSLGTYLAAAVKYKVLNVLAKRSQQLKYAQHAALHVSEADVSTEQWLQFEELRERLEKLVAELPEKCQLVFRLSREKGLSQKEIAATLNISEKTVEAHLARATKHLKVNLGSYALIVLAASGL
ncbi:MAG: RNA polymerase sigma-70 factor [Chitinophagaceae bacterium]